jgi:hypothetical protein
MKKIFPFIFIALAIGIFVFFIDPQYEEVQALSTLKEDNDTMLGLSIDLKRKRELLTDAYNAIGPQDRRELEKLLPDTVDNVRLILAIDNVAAENGVSIRNISITQQEGQQNGSNRNVVSSVDASGDIGTITLSFTIDAPYGVFISFIKDLERALRIVDIKTLDIRVSNVANGFMTYSITLDTYWLR